MKQMGGRDYQLWDEEDGFFYDVLRYPDGSFDKFRVRSLVGLIPLFAVERLEDRLDRAVPGVHAPTCTGSSQNKPRHRRRTCCHPVRARRPASATCCAIVDESQMQRLLSRVLDPDEFLSPYGLRSLSQLPRARTRSRFGEREVALRAGEADSKIKGGNSNWRGPIWFPTSFLMIESLRKLGKAYGPDLTVPARHATAAPRNLLARWREDLAEPLIRIFTRDAAGPAAGLRRPSRSSRTTRTGAT